jgi:cytochrome P450
VTYAQLERRAEELARSLDDIIDRLQRSAGAFDDPDRFDPGRERNRHPALDHGDHYLDQPLARLELHIALDVLFRRLPDVRLVTPPDDLRFKHDMDCTASTDCR